MKYKKHFLNIYICIVLIFIDQITKYFAQRALEDGPFVILNDVFELRYLENRGASFGIMQGGKVFFVILTVIVVALLVFYLARLSEDKRHIPIRIVFLFLLSGAIGNFIDRIVRNYVVDFFYFKLIDFPIFNVADIYVTCSVIVLVLLILFYYKEKELNEILSLKRKNNPVE